MVFSFLCYNTLLCLIFLQLVYCFTNKPITKERQKSGTEFYGRLTVYMYQKTFQPNLSQNAYVTLLQILFLSYIVSLKFLALFPLIFCTRTTWNAQVVFRHLDRCSLLLLDLKMLSEPLKCAVARCFQEQRWICNIRKVGSQLVS